MTALVSIAALDDTAVNEGVETIVIEGQADAGFKVRPVAIRLHDHDYSANRIN